jgi:SAM-dependent methyltransferase
MIKSNNNPQIMTGGDYLAVSYDPAKVPFGPYPAQLATHLHERYLKGPGRILDAGCGRGEFVEAFVGLGYSASGTDISPSAPKFAPHLDIKVSALGYDPLPYEPNSFDFVFSKSVIEHLREPDPFLSAVFQLLKPKGIAIIMTPSWVHNAWGPFYIDHTHVTPFTAPSLEQAMQLSGFGEVNCEHFYQLPSIWRWPACKGIAKAVSLLPLPYRPFNKHAPWPDGLNKYIRFSKEVMLLCCGRKPAKD